MDLSEFKELARERGPRCTLENPALNAEDKQKLLAAFADQSITSQAISRWLEARKVNVSTFPVARHRRGDCRCGRSTK